METTDARIEGEVEGLSFTRLLQESLLWPAVLRIDPPPGWTAQSQISLERSLVELRGVFADPSTDARIRGSACEWLTGYCIGLRKRYGGESPSVILHGRAGLSRKPSVRAS